MAALEPVATSADRTPLGTALRELELAKARVERDAGQVADDTRRSLVNQLLPVLDDIDRTIRAARTAGDAPAVVDGVVLVRSQLEAVLRSYGVERIDAERVRFDPAIHEAITTRAVDVEDAHDHVVEQLAPGYRMGARLLRPAQVVVGKRPARPDPQPVPVEPVAPPRVLPAIPPPRRRVAPAEERPIYVDAYGRRFHVDEYGRPVPVLPRRDRGRRFW